MQNESDHRSFKKRIQLLESAPGEVLVLPVSVPSIVSFYASFTSVPDFEKGDRLVRDLAISMLDKGTLRRSKLELAGLVEDVGGQISFSRNGIRSSVSGKALVKHLPAVLSLVREQLMEPSFPEDEFLRLRERFLASFQQNLVDTAFLATSAINRSIFPPDHPNYSPSPADEIGRLKEISVEEVRSWYATHAAITDWRMAIVGDLDIGVLANSVLSEFPESNDSELRPWPAIYPENSPGDRIEISIPDRDNVDVRLGHSVGLKRGDDDYLPLVIGVFILGGNFSARLMQTVRDEMGLTYGIQSALSGIDRYFSGQWRTSVTLSSENLQDGITATMAEMEKFVSDGVTVPEIEEKRETIAGSYTVGLSTTGTLARAIVGTRERGDDLSFMDKFPDTVRRISAEQVNIAVRRHLHPDLIETALAGTLS